MSKFTVAAKRFGGFMKRNAFYFLIILCIASVATVIALAVTHNSNVPDTGMNNDDDNNSTVINPEPDNNKPDTENPPIVQKLTFITPCNGTISAEYNDSKIVWNGSMGSFETHCGIDFKSTDMNVYASADGTIKEVGYDKLDGNYIVIEHEEGYITKYMSLESESTLKAGAKVKQGQLIGKMAATKGTESVEGAHLHFEVLKNGEQINPLDVLVLDEK